MEERKVAEVFPPGDYIKEELEARGWTQVEFAEILGRPLQLVNEIISGKRGITPETAKGIGEAFGTGAQVWLNLESAYRLSRIRNQDDGVARRSRIYSKAPIKEMVDRKWIEHSADAKTLEKNVLDFFEISSLDEEPALLPHAARKSASYKEITPAQTAWLFRAKKLARTLSVSHSFSQDRLSKAIDQLRELLSNEEDIRQVPDILADAGIRFLIVEPLLHTKIDGACFWLDAESPVVVLSMRFDRIDYFWYTLLHELGHVKNRDGLSVLAIDTDLMAENKQDENEKPEVERKADRFATEKLIPSETLQAFTNSVRPRYAKKLITQFADTIQVHPGIVVGQLQYRKEITYSQNREMLIKVRHIIRQHALTDGWGSVAAAA